MSGDYERSYRASLADPDSAWLCSNCGNVVAEWEPVCGRCENFDTMEWKTPPRITRLDEEIELPVDAATGTMIPSTFSGIMMR